LFAGSRGYGPLRAVMLGSVTRRVASQARCPVIVLARGMETPLGDLLAESEPAASPT
jgi:Universal stress protein family